MNGRRKCINIICNICINGMIISNRIFFRGNLLCFFIDFGYEVEIIVV